MIALIPAKEGSERVVNKHTRKLGDHPLVAYTISAAEKSGVFDEIYLAGDSERLLDIGSHYGAKGILRPLSLPGEPDIEWVRHCLKSVARNGVKPKSYSILRCTSPFKTYKDIREASRLWDKAIREGFTSLRAVEKCSQHPAKMWKRLEDGRIVPVLLQPDDRKWHDSQYQTLPDVYVQNASLEMSLTAQALNFKTISGPKIYGYLTTGDAGFDLNFEYDWKVAEAKIILGEVKLPDVKATPWVG